MIVRCHNILSPNRKSWLLLLFIVIASSVEAQQLLFRNYSVADGLPSSTVRAIAQDDQGYMWFGTKNGLSRFDGYQFRNFQFRVDDPHSIGNNFIYCISRYDSTHFWIGASSGLYRLNLETEQFESLLGLANRTVFDILRIPDGRVFISTRLNGLYIYDPLRDSTTQLRSNSGNTGPSVNQLTKMVADENGMVYIGSFGNGLEIYDTHSGKFSNLNTHNSAISNDFINALHLAEDGKLWVGTMNGGLICWDRHRNSFQTYQKGGEGSISDNIVRVITQSSPGKLYVGTEKGVNVLDLSTQKFTAYTNKTNDPLSISDNAIYALYCDQQDNFWVGSFFGGVSYFHENGSAFTLYYPSGEKNELSGRVVSSFLEDQPGKFWIGTEDGGLNYFDATTQQFLAYPFRPGQEKLSYHNVHALMRDREGRLWIALFAGGLNIYDPRTGKVERFRHEIGDPTTLNSNNVFSFFEDRSGAIWVGTDIGLNRYDPVSHSFSPVLQEGILNNIIYDFYEDDQQTIWIASYDNGLISYNRKTDEWKRIRMGKDSSHFSSPKMTSLLMDKEHQLWIGTDGGGLNRYDTRTGSIKVFDEKAGILGNIIYGIQEDQEGRLWFTSNNGIYSLDPGSGSIRHFSKEDNLQSQQFNYTALYKATDGRLLAGGIRGFNSFYPDRFSQSSNQTSITFTNFQLFNKNVAPGTDGHNLTKRINYSEGISLGHDQSVFSFEFAALNYQAPFKVRYAYKMEGFDDDWNYVGEQRKATYTNLSPGSYTFRVKASTDESNWDIPEASIQVTILPPFYQTPLAYLLYILAAVLIGYAIYRYSANYIRRQNQIKLERLKNKEEQEFYARKIEFFTVMAHEIRTPLSLIIAPLDKLLALHEWDPQVHGQLKVMDENASRLLDLVNQLLDFRRIESDAYEIRKEQVEIVSTVQAVYSRFSSIPYNKPVEFQLSTSLHELYLQADPEVLNKILSNLLINAFKFARTKVRLELQEIRRRDSQEPVISISVEDDGIGIPHRDLRNIFKQFFTTSSGDHQYHNLGGTGIGLALASSLAERHGGRLLVESREGVRTVFTVELPIEDKPVAEPQTLTAEASDEADSGNPIVLITEDDATLRSFVADSLRGEGYAVEAAANGKEAMRILNEKNIDLVISDLMMPEMNGIELCAAVKSNFDYSHIPFVLLTAKGNTESEIEGIETGADAYILKPFRWKHVSAIVRNLLDSRERLRMRYSEQPDMDASVLTTNDRDREFMDRVISVIRQRMMDPQLSVEELSREMAMSRSSLHRKLKSLSGLVPNEWIKLVRLKHAAQLLSSGQHTVAEVTYLSGFSSPSYFSKCFHQQFGLSPKDYADKHYKPSAEAPDLLKG